jgi:hypothetical protein
LSHKKTFDFLFAFPVLSGKFGKQFLRFLTTKTFFFGITGFFVPESKPRAHKSSETRETILFFPDEYDVRRRWPCASPPTRTTEPKPSLIVVVVYYNGESEKSAYLLVGLFAAD